MSASRINPLRVGLMVPINNTTMERELLAWLPAGSRCTTLRIPRGKGLLTPETMPAYREQALALAATFADLDIDCVVYGCTAAGFIAGPAGEAELAARIAEITGKAGGDDGAIDGFCASGGPGKGDRASHALPRSRQRTTHGFSHRCRHPGKATGQLSGG